MKTKAEIQGEIEFLNNVVNVNQRHKELLKEVGNTTPELESLSDMQIQKATEKLKFANERLKAVEMDEENPTTKIQQSNFELKVNPSAWERGKKE